MAVKCEKLIYTPIDALSFRISGDTHALTPNIENDIIQSLESPEGDIFSLGLIILRMILLLKYKKFNDINKLENKIDEIENEIYKNIILGIL